MTIVSCSAQSKSIQQFREKENVPKFIGSLENQVFTSKKLDKTPISEASVNFTQIHRISMK